MNTVLLPKHYLKLTAGKVAKFYENHKQMGFVFFLMNIRHMEVQLKKCNKYLKQFMLLKIQMYISNTKNKEISFQKMSFIIEIR